MTRISLPWYKVLTKKAAKGNMLLIVGFWIAA